MKDRITILQILKKNPPNPTKLKDSLYVKVTISWEYMSEILNPINLIVIQVSVVLQKKKKCVALLEAAKDDLGKCRSTARKAESYISM